MKKLLIITALIMISPLTANATCYGGCNYLETYLDKYFEKNIDKFKGEKGDPAEPAINGIDGINGVNGIDGTNAETINNYSTKTIEHRYQAKMDISAALAASATLGDGLGFAAQAGPQGINLAAAAMKKIDGNFRAGLAGVYDTYNRDFYGAVMVGYSW